MKASGKNQGTTGGSGSGGLKNATNLSRLERYQPKVFALKGSENLVKIKMNNSKESFIEKSLLKFIGRSSMFRMLEIKEDLVNDWDYGDRGLLGKHFELHKKMFISIFVIFQLSQTSQIYKIINKS